MLLNQYPLSHYHVGRRLGALAALDLIVGQKTFFALIDGQSFEPTLEHWCWGTGDTTLEYYAGGGTPVMWCISPHDGYQQMSLEMLPSSIAHLRTIDSAAEHAHASFVYLWISGSWHYIQGVDIDGCFADANARHTAVTNVLHPLLSAQPSQRQPPDIQWPTALANAGFFSPEHAQIATSTEEADLAISGFLTVAEHGFVSTSRAQRVAQVFDTDYDEDAMFYWLPRLGLSTSS